VTTVQWSSRQIVSPAKHRGNYMHRLLWHLNSSFCWHSVFVCACDPDDKQRLSPSTTSVFALCKGDRLCSP
jgi:hypothetical protein